MAKSKSKSKNKIVRFAWVFTLLLLLTLVIAFLFYNKKYIRRAYRHFAHRNQVEVLGKTKFPEGYTVHGLDISHFQDEIDWNRLYAISTEYDTVRFSFVFVKATEGLLSEDDDFQEHFGNAKSHGIIRGAYHYYRTDRGPELQAKNYIRHAKLQSGDLPPVVDIEDIRSAKKEDLVHDLKLFLQALEIEYKVRPIIYSNENFIEDYLSDDFEKYPFWIAHYFQDEMELDEQIHWLFWQHSNKATIPGCDTPVDVNVFNGTLKELKALAIP